MKNRKIYWLVVCFIILFSVYLFDISVAMAAPKPDAAASVAQQNAEAGTNRSTTQSAEAGTNRSTAQSAEAGVNRSTAQSAEAGANRSTAQSAEAGANHSTAQSAEAGTSQNTTQSAGSSVSQNTTQDAEPDTVSTADEFKEWLESHKNNGGRVKLTNNIVLKEFYYFTPNGGNRPDIVVDTDTYTITAAGYIAFLSDGHLIFQGKARDKGIFHVVKGGILTLDGVFVKSESEGTSPQYALWQEEGAGLVLENTYTKTSVTGNIHYADAPLVTEESSVCVVVEKGQSAESLLPTEIKCTVNHQGQIWYNKPTPVSWDLAGTEKHQQNRQRFQVKGFSSQVLYYVAPKCTVVYNDYPLTFTEVDAFIRANAYYFQGKYTKPKGELPITVAAEYSFDGKNWIRDEVKTVSSDSTGFSVSFPCDEWDTDQNPSVYIRLQGEKDDKRYFSNVLRYKANSMNEAEDLGDSGSVVNPPDKPEPDSDHTSSGSHKPEEGNKPSEGNKPPAEQKPSDDRKPSDHDAGKHEQESNDKGSSDKDNASGTNPLSEDTSDAAAQETAQNDINTDTYSSGHNSVTAIPENPADTQQTENADNSSNTDTASLTVKPAENGKIDTGSIPGADKDRNNDFAETEGDEALKETVEVMSVETAAPAEQGEHEDAGRQRQLSVHQRLDRSRNIFLVSGLVTFSVGLGVVAYFVHTRKLRRRRHRTSGTGHGRKRRK